MSNKILSVVFSIVIDIMYKKQNMEQRILSATYLAYYLCTKSDSEGINNMRSNNIDLCKKRSSYEYIRP